MKFKGYLEGAEHEVQVVPIDGGYEVTVDGQTRVVDAARLEASFYSMIVDGRSYEIAVGELEGDVYAVTHAGHLREVRIVDPLAVAAGAALGSSGPAEVKAIMAGRVVELLVELGQRVEEGQPLVVLEAMKMENEVLSPRAGVVCELPVSAGETLETGASIATIE